MTRGRYKKTSFLLFLVECEIYLFMYLFSHVSKCKINNVINNSQVTHRRII